ncbi:transmembrane protein, putative [Bodo saltans]|uniref:Transmembrane protein, putative n=1 Tax=Bodo saltans TaxID=75058 RepID=A0A0S4J6T7_BODSA|nr:transmembrane protein, putative [Bodo saltans]|eukprot:CUG87187.1 transmembrane protein, putative [Bodo saltans]
MKAATTTAPTNRSSPEPQHNSNSVSNHAPQSLCQTATHERRETYPIESAVVSRLRGFHAKQLKKAAGGKLPPGALQNIIRVVLLRQGIPTIGTFVLLLIGSILHSTNSSVYIVSTIVIFLLYSMYSFLQYELLRARATEMRARSLRVLEDVMNRWGSELLEYKTATEAAALAKHNALTTTPTTTTSPSVLGNDSNTLVVQSGNNSFVACDSNAWCNTTEMMPPPTPSGEDTDDQQLFPQCPPQHRKRSFMKLDAALLAARSMRLVAARTLCPNEGRTSGLMVIPKCLLLRGNITQRFDEYELQWETFREGGSRDLCKLLDCLRVIFDRDAVMLKALGNVARPPRLPNLRIAALLEEEVETTDESDGERETRSVIGGRSTTSMPNRMEYFVMRLMTLSWAACLVLLAVVGLFRALLAEGNHSIAYECIVQPVVVVLGFLPLNGFLVNRLLYLVNNARVHIYATTLLAIRAPTNNAPNSGRSSNNASVDYDSIKLERPPISRLIETGWNVIRYPGQRSDLPVYLARSAVETLGTVTVIAELDSTGIITDMVPLPVSLLVIKENAGANSSSSSSDEDERLFLTQKSLEATRLRKREMRIQVRRKRFQEERFTELKLSPSSEPNLAVAFSEPDESRMNAASINPVSLCALLHAFAPPPVETFVWSEGLHFVDRARSWSQNLLWIAKASSFHESAVRNFHIFARIFSVHSSKCAEVDSVAARYPEQSCSIVCRDTQGQVHVFMMGTTKTVVDACSSYWTGKETEEFDDHEKAEVRFFAEKQWGTAQGMDAVAVSHRVLPDRYQRFLTTLEEGSRLLGRPLERYFVNGVQVRSNESVTAAAAERPSSAGLARKRSAGDFLDDSFLLLDRLSRPPRLRKVLSHGDMPQFHGGPLEHDSTLSADTFVPFMTSTNHTLLGLVALRDSIRPLVQSAISALDDAGIRFMHFGSGSEQRTKAFGDRIGLETDWNCCISLKAESVALDPHSIRAQLPFGIPSIRKHIIYVDPIPLQVNLFSHSRGVSTRSMIAVLQDNHEVVLGIGSVLNHCNTRSLVQADYSVGVLPSREGAAFSKHNTQVAKATQRRLQDLTKCSAAQSPRGNSLKQSTKRKSVVHVHANDDDDVMSASSKEADALQNIVGNVADLLGTACSLDVGRCPMVLPVLVRLIRESRVLLSAMSNCNEFILQANGFLVSLNVLTVFLGLPLFLSTGSILLILNVAIPLLGLGCHHSVVFATDPMKVKQAKQNFDTRMDMLLHVMKVFLMRFTPSVVAGVLFPSVLVRLWCVVTEMYVDVAMNMTMVSSTRIDPWKLSAETSNEDEAQCLADVRSVTFFVTVLWLSAHALTHVSRHQSVGLVTQGLSRRGGSSAGRPRFNVRDAKAFFVYMFGAATSSVLLHLLTVHNPQSYSNKVSAPVIVWLLVALFFPVVLFLLDIPIKSWRAKRYSDMQKFRTLSYGTRLGMHSPRGDYEPSEEDDNDAELPSAEHNATNADGTSATGVAVPSVERRTLRQRTKEFLFRWCSILHGSLENQCVCCDHDGGHPAQYYDISL